MEITLGRAPQNDYVIDDVSVSNNHAIIEYENDKNIIIQDLNSTNGTFVNAIQIAKKKINLSENIKLGDFELDNRQLKNLIQQAKKYIQTDFSEEFYQLETVYNQYIKELNKIDTNSKNKLLIIRLVLTIVLMLLVYLIFKKPMFMILVGIVSTMLTNFLINPSDLKEKREDKLLEYTKLFKCPKCSTELIRQSWKYWKQKGECPNPKCNATWK